MFVTLLTAIAVLTVPPVRRWRIRRQAVIDEQQFFLAVHSELRAGASLRQAIAAAADGQPGAVADDINRAARSTEPMSAVLAALGRLPLLGSTAQMGVRVAVESGGGASDVFLRVAERARTEIDLRRQRSTLTTQARLSAAIVVSLPMLWLLFGGWSRLEELAANGGRAVAVVGLGMEALGVALVWRLAAT